MEFSIQQAQYGCDRIRTQMQEVGALIWLANWLTDAHSVGNLPPGDTATSSSPSVRRSNCPTTCQYQI